MKLKIKAKQGTARHHRVNKAMRHYASHDNGHGMGDVSSPTVYDAPDFTGLEGGTPATRRELRESCPGFAGLAEAFGLS